MNIGDAKLNVLLENISTTNDLQKKAALYKKASDRLDSIKKKYNTLCEKLQGTTEDESDDEFDNMNLCEIFEKMEQTMKIITSNEYDMESVVDSYLQYKILLENAQKQSVDIKNVLYNVKSQRQKIKLVEIDIDQI